MLPILLVLLRKLLFNLICKLLTPRCLLTAPKQWWWRCYKLKPVVPKPAFTRLRCWWVYVLAVVTQKPPLQLTPNIPNHPSPTAASRRLPALQSAVQPCCSGLQQRPRRRRGGGGRGGGRGRAGPLLPWLPPSVLPPTAFHAGSRTPRLPLQPHPLWGRGAEVAGRRQEVFTWRRHRGQRGRRTSEEEGWTHLKCLSPARHPHTHTQSKWNPAPSIWNCGENPSLPLPLYPVVFSTWWNYVNSSVDSCTISL